MCSSDLLNLVFEKTVRRRRRHQLAKKLRRNGLVFVNIAVYKLDLHDPAALVIARRAELARFEGFANGGGHGVRLKGGLQRIGATMQCEIYCQHYSTALA